MYVTFKKNFKLGKKLHCLFIFCLYLAISLSNCLAESTDLNDISANSSCNTQADADAASGSLVLSENEIKLTIPKHFTYVFNKSKDGKWLWGSILVWDGEADAMTPAFSSAKGDFFSVMKDSVKREVYAERYEEIHKKNIVGVKFYGTADVGTDLKWQASFIIDSSVSLPFIKVEINYSANAPFKLDEAPGICLESLDAREELTTMSNIMGYLRSEESGQITLEQDFPVVWLQANIDGKNYNTLSVVETNEKTKAGSFAGKTFAIGRNQIKSPRSSYFCIANKTDKLSENKSGKISVDFYHSIGGDWLTFYRNTWSGLIDHFCPPSQIPFWAKNWEECAKGLMEDLKDKDGELYMPGKGYIIGAGGTHTHWYVATQFVHGFLYYSWATNDTENFDFYQKRLKDCKIHDWWVGPTSDDGLIWGKFADGNVQVEGNMWQMLDFGAYPVYNIYRLTGDEYYLNFFKRYMDYVMANLTDNDSLGEWWNVKEKKWVYHANGGFHDSKSLNDHRDYPGALAVYAYLCLLTYEETGYINYKDKAYGFIEYINSFLSNPGKLYTIAPDTKTNGFAFAMMANIKKYELTNESEYLDHAEQWAYIMLTMYSLNEGKNLGFAHAGGQGLGEFFCIPTLETIEPANLLASLLKYRVNPAFLKFFAIADRRHLGAFAINHEGYGKNTKHCGVAKDLPWHKYKYLTLELIPNSSDPAIYMAGAPMIQNILLHGLHDCSDDEITVICTDAAETSMKIKQQRNMVVYNPTKTKRDFIISFSGFDAGNYKVNLNEQKKVKMSSLQLKRGLSISLDADDWARIVITQVE